MIKEIRNGFRVVRFHTQHRHHEESVGHHSANVCAIILRLEPGVNRRVLIRALMHDVPEAYTGDSPYPFKADYPEVKEILERGEQEYIDAWQIPHPDLAPWEERLIKFADMLDLVLSGIEEMGRGNMYAKEYVQRGQDYINCMDVPAHYMTMAEHMVQEVKGEWQNSPSK